MTAPLNRQNKTSLTLWQRLWSSPLVWLVIALLLVGDASKATTTGGRVLLWFLAVVAWISFFDYADKRWGKRP